VRDTIEATGLMTADAGFRLELRPGAQPPGHGFCTWDFQWEGASEPVHVRSDMWLGDEEESTYYQPAPERETLDGLARRLQDPEAWIEASGWADPEAVPYAPIGYLVMTTVLPPQLAVAGAPDVDALSWPFPGAPGAFAEGPTLPDSESRCMEANTAEVEALAAQLAAAGLEQFVDPTGGSNVTLPWASRGASLDLYFYPQHPDGEPPCGGSATDPPS